jgi:hypothetical protein
MFTGPGRAAPKWEVVIALSPSPVYSLISGGGDHMVTDLNLMG